MTVAFVPGTANSVAGTSTVTLTLGAQTYTSGNCLVVAVSYNDQYSAGISTPFDSNGNTWSSAVLDTPVDSTQPHGVRVAVFYALNINGTAGQTVSVTSLGGATNLALAVGEWSGVATVSALDRFTSANSIASDPRSSGVTSTRSTASELLVGIGAQNETFNSDSGTVSGAWNLVASQNAAYGTPILIAYQIVSSIGTDAFTYNVAVGTAASGIITLKAAGSGDGTLAITDAADTCAVAGSILTRSVTLTLVASSTDSTAQSSLSSLKWAYSDAMPWTGASPIAYGTAETTDGSGIIVIPIVGSSYVTTGSTGYLVVTNSDGTTSQNPAPKAFAGPVTVAVA